MVGSIYARTANSRYILKEGRETPEEIKKSKTSPGAGDIAVKNKSGYPYSWLIYNFAVGDDKLKDGHKQYLNGLIDEIRRYGNTHNKTGTVLVSGHASPSGVHGANVDLANRRANNVKNHIIRSGRLPTNWFYVKNKISNEYIYSVVKGTPTTPNARSYCRGVHVVLYLSRDTKPIDRFPESQRIRARGQLSGKFEKYEERFYYWVIDNWTYLKNPSNNYCWEASPLEHGLFFKPPTTTLNTDQMVWNYLKNLHKKYLAAAKRLKNEYTGVPQASALPAGGDPVRCYQQLARWIALDAAARSTSVHVFHFTIGESIQKAFNDLIVMINDGKFDRDFKSKSNLWKKIEDYMKKKRIPLRVVKAPVR